MFNLNHTKQWAHFLDCSVGAHGKQLTLNHGNRHYVHTTYQESL